MGWMRKCRIARDMYIQHLFRSLTMAGWHQLELKSELYSAAMDGDWKKAKEIFEQYPKEITPSTGLNVSGETCLHIAVRAGHIELVERLVEMMSEEDLSIQTITGDTALSSAFRHGYIEIATIMLKKKPCLGLATLRTSLVCNWKYCSPISSLFGHSHMVRRIYEVTKNLLDERDHVDLLLRLIDLCLYDIAKEMLSENPGLAIRVNSKGETALYAIAGNVPETRNRLPKRKIELIKTLLKQANGHTDLIKGAIFRAVREGNCEFLTRALHLYPGLAIELDDNKHTIFHVAVQHRHLDVLNFFQEIDSIRSFFKLMTDREGNNILHLAAKLPLSGLVVVAGAGPEHMLQLQQELRFFEEVKKVVGPHHMESKNGSCTQLFDKEHEELRRKGEKWLKKTAESCMLVATLITTVSFIAGLGALGNRHHTGRPVLVDDLWFTTFATSNTITLLFSASSVLFFLSILTATFSMNAFLKSLPFKLVLSLFSLVTSILAMMVSCFAAFSGTFNHHELRFAYPVAVVAFISVPFVTRLYLPLLYHVFCSTIMPFLEFRRNRFFCQQFENKYE